MGIQKIRNVLVFCGARMGNDPALVRAAHDFGQIIGENRLRLIYGGGSLGLMVTVATSVIGHGGTVTGVLPAFLREKEPPLECLRDPPHELIITENMPDRKRIMFERADAIATLPGGDGTLDEFYEEKTEATLGRRRRPHVLANIDGYWDPLIALMKHTQERGFASPDPNLTIVNRIDEILPAMRRVVGEVSDNVIDMKSQTLKAAG